MIQQPQQRMEFLLLNDENFDDDYEDEFVVEKYDLILLV
jgi:hypothetical protein